MDLSWVQALLKGKFERDRQHDKNVQHFLKRLGSKTMTCILKRLGSKTINNENKKFRREKKRKKFSASFSASRPKAAKRPRAKRAGRHNLEAPEKVKNKEGMAGGVRVGVAKNYYLYDLSLLF